MTVGLISSLPSLDLILTVSSDVMDGQILCPLSSREDYFGINTSTV